MTTSEQEYLQLIRDDPDGQWELHCGVLWSKSKEPVTWKDSDTFGELGHMLRSQLDREQFVVRWNAGRARRSATQYYIPDLMVVPRELAARLFPIGDETEIYPEPLPLVVEVWSPSTGRVDVVDKLPEYQRRGDQEIWLIHPYDKVLTAWVRQPDGRYTETAYRGGIIRPAALPNVAVDLDELFAL